MLEERTDVARDYLALEAPRPSVAGAVKRRYQRIGLGLVVTDAFCAGAALLLAYGPRVSIGSLSVAERLLVLAAPLLWVALFHAFSLYGPQRLAAAEEFRRIIGASSLGVVLLALVGYWSQHSLWGLGVGLSWLVALFLELLTRRAWRWYQHRLKVDGRLALRTLVVGTNRDATHLAATLRQPGSGFNPIGYVRARGQPASTSQGPYGVLGELRQVRSLIRDQVADCLFITSTSVSAEEVSEVAQVARQEGVEVRLSAGIAETLTSRLALQQIGPVIALSVKPVRLAGAQAAGKRAFDLVAASLGLLVTLPLWIVAAAAIRLTSSGAVLFHQERVTKAGRHFRMHKFRTMHELPHLLNILAGEMSLVGPRPLPAEQVAANRELLGPRLEVPAGMTGWWQINGRSEVTPEEALHLDQFYIENWSLTLDLYILLKTVGVVLKRQGAW